MATLAYRTRGDSSPQNKERIYFTCHPQDFETYFIPICDDIFKTQNCVIWYDEFLVPGENFNNAIRDQAEERWRTGKEAEKLSGSAEINSV